MPSRLLLAVAVVTAMAMGSRPAAQAPSLPEVLQRTAAYVKRFQTQLSEIVAEETYHQVVYRTGAYQNPILENAPTRVTLRSDLMLVRPLNADRYVEFRDVFEVDGKTVRERQQRVADLWRTESTESTARLGEILAQSSRYNIGGIQRNINTPLMALVFLDAANQRRVAFKRAEKSRPVLQGTQPDGDAAVFRVGTEMWDVEFEEKRGGTIIRRPNGGDLRSRGRFWIDPATGAVLISELIVDGGGVLARVTVSYQSEPLMGFLVPIEMRESYERRHETITGRAVYGRFRLVKE